MDSSSCWRTQALLKFCGYSCALPPVPIYRRHGAGAGGVQLMAKTAPAGRRSFFYGRYAAPGRTISRLIFPVKLLRQHQHQK
jgi:hypothetical protein